jgi:hypothetical protein
MCGFRRPVVRKSLAARLSYGVATRRHDAARSATVCSMGNTPDKFAFRADPVAQHILDCVVTWQTAVRVLGSAGWTCPPTPAAQPAKEMS